METTTNNRFNVSRQFLLGILAGLLITVLVGSVVAAAGVSTGMIEEEQEIENIAPGELDVTDTEAREAVLADYPDSTVDEVELEREDGSLLYEVELDTGEEVLVDATTGEVLGLEPEDDDADDDES